MSDIPWAGLLGILAMLVIPFVPDWLFEGARTIKHRPRRYMQRLRSALDRQLRLRLGTRPC